MGAMPDLILLRHGESTYNRANLFTGWIDCDLTERGVEEARRAGEKLASLGIEPDICLTSLLKRAIVSAEIVLSELNRSWIPVERNWRLNERHYGALQGLNKKQTAEKYGEDQVHIWRRSYDIPPPLLDDHALDEMKRDPRYQGIGLDELPRGESLADVLKRMEPYWQETVIPLIAASKSVIIVAHGNSLRALVKHLENLDSEQIMAYEIPTGQPIIYRIENSLEIQTKSVL
jgi:2,3-bisphosphoglycerate-dependent phosphoglycerate mutase